MRNITFSVNPDNDGVEKIKAIKGVRALTGLGLKEAKELVEKIMEKDSVTTALPINPDVNGRSEGLSLLDGAGILATDHDENNLQTLLQKVKELATDAVEIEQYGLATDLIHVLKQYKTSKL